MIEETLAPVIYLDHNATTPIAPEVADAMEPYMRTEYGNPSSDHVLGRRARLAVEEAREQVATLIGADPEEIVFTSGGTESNNMAIRGVAAMAPESRRRIVISAVEHPATTAPSALLEASGFLVTRLPIGRSGSLDLAAAAAAIGDNVSLLSVMLAQNETGALMPVAELAAAARDRGAITHTDAAQAIGKIPVSIAELKVDLLSIAGHKFYGPKGVGALYIRRGTPLSPLVVGASQERGMRPGTENVAGIVGLGTAARLAVSRLMDDHLRIAKLRDDLWKALSTKISGVIRHTPKEACLPNTLLVSFPGVLGADVLARIPQLAASTGSACHAGEYAPNATLIALGAPLDVALGAVRLSLGRATTAGEIAKAAELLADAYQTTISTNSPGPNARKGNVSK